MATFELHGKEYENRDAFYKKHKECIDKYLAKGHHTTLPFNYTFTPFGIGVGVTISCPYCGASEDITDIGTW